MKMNKTGQLGGLSGNVIAIVLAIIILVLGLVIVQELRDTQTAGTEAHTAANDSLLGLAQFADFIPLIVLAVAAAVVIGVILTAFVMNGRTR